MKLAVVVAVLLGIGMLPSSAADEEGYPEHPQFPGQGFPDIRVHGANWITPQMSSVSYVARAKQWARTPSLQVAAHARPQRQISDPTPGCNLITQEPGLRTLNTVQADLMLVNQDVALDAADRFGRTESFEVSSAAFGSIPVTAAVSLEQSRNAEGVVIPFVLIHQQGIWCPGRGPFDTRPPDRGSNIANAVYLPASFEDQVAVRIDALEVDGVPLELTGQCRADGATLGLTTTRWNSWDPSLSIDDVPLRDTAKAPEFLTRSKYWSVGIGGFLFGTLDIPAFAGCHTTAGEDVSALLTATISGDGNRVEVSSQALVGEGGGLDDQCPFVGGNCAPFFPPRPIPDSVPEGD